jgi:hypothetical protein
VPLAAEGEGRRNKVKKETEERKFLILYLAHDIKTLAK